MVDIDAGAFGARAKGDKAGGPEGKTDTGAIS